MSTRVMSKKVRGSYIIGLIISVLFIVLFASALIVDANRPYYYPGKGEDIGVFIFFVVVASIGAIISCIFIYHDYTMSDEEKEEKEEEDKIINEMIRKKQEQKSGVYIDNISYIGGHDTITTETPRFNSILTIKDDSLVYYSNDKKLFTIPISKIRSVIYDKSENITLARAVTLGFGALMFKKKTYYLTQTSQQELSNKHLI
jgi:hypothetical protein